MMHRLRSAFVIARRDFSATVLSKAFIFFLLAPLFPLLFGGVFSPSFIPRFSVEVNQVFDRMDRAAGRAQRRLEAAGRHGGIGVDAHQRSSVAGVYAAGDVVIGLDQISHAMGEGGVAATTIRNDLAKDAPFLR